MKKAAIAIGLFLAGRWAYNKLLFAQNVSFQFVDAALQAGFPITKMVVQVKIINPTGTFVSLSNLNGNLSLNGVSLGTANSPNVFTVPANDSINCTIYIYLNSITTVQTIVNAIGNKAATFNFTGTITASNIILPVNFDYKLL